MASYFLSDIHLKDPNEGSFLVLIRFFDEVWSRTPGDVYLLGDIFDAWVSDHSVFINKYKTLVDRLINIKRLGYRVVYFEGNHDLHLKRYWKDTLGFEVFFNADFFMIENQMVRLEHGDEINLNDHAYLRLRHVLRTNYMLWLGRNLPGYFWDWFATKWSSKSRKNSGGYLIKNESEVIKMIRDHAVRCFEQKHFDLIITGHMHVFDFFKQDAKYISINLGSWMDTPKVLELTDRRLSLWTFGNDSEKFWKKAILN